MSPRFEVAIIGLGAMGSAAAYHLVRRGRRVLGLDRFAPPHTMGSSHGQTRIIREAYFEHPQYVPIVQHAYTCWARLEEESGERLFEQTGGLAIGRPDSGVVAGARASVERHRLPYEELSAAEVHRRCPALQLEEDMVALLEPRAGMLFPERCVEAHLRLAAARGATLRTNETVTAWQPSQDEVTIETTSGRYTADRLVIAAGAWLPTLVPDLALPLAIERAIVHWFDPGEHAVRFVPERLPVFIFEYAAGLKFYGFPARPEGVKVARHHQGELTEAARVRRDVAPEEVAAMRSLLARFLPDLHGAWRGSSVCLYTNTPDDDFIIDAHPEHPQVLIVSPCSGHGFKFSSAIGEIVADLVTDGRSGFDLTPFRLSRFARALPQT
ncbi:MAG: N-methyl-L-tryptophan oxidase [Luteitalea sp.]|nr:N-methyl-L-tryptophan oxidase [Luteitalea sp.]